MAIFSGAVGVAAGPACRQQEALPQVVGTAAAPRRVDIKVSNLGYTPGRIAGRPGEALTLVFHYDKSAGECGHEVLLPNAQDDPQGGNGKDATRLTLSADHPVEALVTLPQTKTKSELTFTCGMGMLRGTLAVVPQ